MWRSTPSRTEPSGPRRSELAGDFDESLVRNQDDELNLRLRLAGGRIVLDPSIRVRYRPRGSLTKVFRQYYEYGRWKVPVMLKHRRALSSRSLVPVAFVSSLAVTCDALSTRSGLARRMLAGEIVLYGALRLRLRRSEHSVGEVSPGRSCPRRPRHSWLFTLATALGMLRGWLGALFGDNRLLSASSARACPTWCSNSASTIIP